MTEPEQWNPERLAQNWTGFNDMESDWAKIMRTRAVTKRVMITYDTLNCFSKLKLIFKK